MLTFLRLAVIRAQISPVSQRRLGSLTKALTKVKYPRPPVCVLNSCDESFTESDAPRETDFSHGSERGHPHAAGSTGVKRATTPNTLRLPVIL